MADYTFSVDGPETAEVGPNETATVPNLAVFDTDDTVTGTGGGLQGDNQSILLFDIATGFSLDLTGYSGITGFDCVQVFNNAANQLVIGQDFFDDNAFAGADLFVQILETGSAIGGTFDASDLDASSAVTFMGGNGDDLLIGGAGDDTINSGAFGNDIIASGGGGGAGEQLIAQAGDDTFVLRGSEGGTFAGSLDGGADTDTLQIEGLVDVTAATITGLESLSFAGSGASVVHLADTQVAGLSFIGRAAQIDRAAIHLTGTSLDFSGVTFSDIDSFIFWGTTGADSVTGTGTSDFFRAENGGADSLAGGDGSDRYYIGQAGVTVVEAVNQGTDAVYASVNYTLTDNVENLFLTADAIQGIGNTSANDIRGNGFANNLQGLAGADTISGGGGNDTIDGGADSDRLKGDAGDDRLIGGGGRDALWGGAGADTVFLYATAGNIQKIYDFALGTDKFEVSEALFGQDFGSGPTLDAAFFRNNTTGKAQDLDDRFIYNSANGAVYYDADGTGAAARFHIASLTPGLALTESDFLLV